MTTPSTAPNILFIVADQHNAKVLGHQGHPEVLTPQLDRMAAEGLRCSRAITQNPICTPSRVSFLSGQYCHNHGYYGLSGPNPGGLPNVFGHFRRAGYRTAAIGKIHCPEYWVEDECDVFAETCGTSVGGRSAEYADFLRQRGKLELEDHGAMPEFGPRGRQSMEGRPSPLAFDECQEGWIAHKAVAVMEQAKADGRPFFIHASLPRPHQCTAPCQEFWDLYEGQELTLPPNADWDLEGKAPNLRRSAANWRKGDWALIEPRTFEAARQRKLRGYLAAVSQVDAAVGVMLDHLRAAGLDQDTVVIYTADHGDFACEHDIMEKAPGISSDAITRVPMLWWGSPQVKAGHVVDEIVELVDLPNTFSSLAGLEPLETADGVDIAYLLAGGRGEVHRVGVTEFAWSKSLRRGPYRYIHYPPEMFAEDYPDGFGELYHVEEDPWEMQNLFFDPAHQDTVRQLQRELLDWLITTTRPTTVNGANAGGRRRLVPDAQRVERFKAQVNRDGKFHPDRLREIAGANYL